MSANNSFRSRNSSVRQYDCLDELKFLVALRPGLPIPLQDFPLAYSRLRDFRMEIRHKLDGRPDSIVPVIPPGSTICRSDSCRVVEQAPRAMTLVRSERLRSGTFERVMRRRTLVRNFGSRAGGVGMAIKRLSGLITTRMGKFRDPTVTQAISNLPPGNRPREWRELY